MVVLEDQRKGPKEKVKDAQQDRTQYAKVETLKHSISPPMSPSTRLDSPTIGSKTSS
jgi:hypothetical protein